MSLSTSFSSILSALSHPPIVLTAGAAIATSIPYIVPALAASPFSSLPLLQAANVVAYAINVASVSVPGRWDSPQQDDQVKLINRGGTSTSTAVPASSDSNNDDKDTGNVTTPDQLRGRSLVQPSGWAFSIWSIIYIGELTFCGVQFMDSSTVQGLLLPHITGPFVAANLIQSLWCASFRPSFNKEWWHKYVSVAMLGGTAYSLSYISTAITGSDPIIAGGWLFVPLMMHFGWATAATLVNFNTSIASSGSVSSSTIIAVGHTSAVLATILGVTIPLLGLSTPVYGMTIAWALLAVASNPISSKVPSSSSSSVPTQGKNDAWYKGAKVQKMLCYTGSALCLGSSVFVMAMGG
jgi:hypothetical protein